MEDYFASFPQTLLTKEEIDQLAVNRQASFDLFILNLLRVPQCRKYIINEWRKRVNIGKPITKLSNDYGSSSYTSEDIRKHLSECFIRAENLDEHNCTEAAIVYLIKAKLSVGLYTKAYKKNLYAVQGSELHSLFAQYIVYRNKLIEANRRLVPKFASKFSKLGVPFIDLVQEGNIGLVRAAEKYDPGMDIRFSSYASWWVIQTIRRAIKNDSRMIRLPHHVYDEITKLNKAKTKFKNTAKREPSLQESMNMTGLSKDKVERINSIVSEVLSLDTKAKVSSGSRKETIKDIIKDEEAEKRILNAVDLSMLKGLMESTLTIFEREVVIGRYGIDQPERTISFLSKKLGVAPDKIRKSEIAAIEKLREKLRE